MDLFDNSDSEDEKSQDHRIKTNTNYAKHYDEFRRKEILSHLKNISDDSSSSDDASTDEELVNPEFDKEFFKSLAFLKNKNPKKYENIPTFFQNMKSVEETVRDKQTKSKPITVADYQRERLIKTEGRMSEDENDDYSQLPVQDLTYVQEQQKIKDDLKKALDGSDDEDETNRGGMFKVRDKSKDELESEKVDYLKWLAGQKKDDIGEDAKDLKPLKDFWTSKAIPNDDKFLKDYILNQRYLENGEVPSYDDIVGLSEDEIEVENQVEYEHKYNFRFEDPDTEYIKRFPREMDDTVRVTDTSRKEKRQERKERKHQEKELKMKDLREFQNIRKREIEEKLVLLKEVAGNEDLCMELHDLNTDFDPAEHDKRMSAMFDNSYYGIDEGDQKPEFPDLDEEMNIENWDNFDKNKTPQSAPEVEEEEVHCEDDEFNMDADYDPHQAKKSIQDELIEMTKGRKKKRKLSKLAELIKREKPAFNPESEKTYQEYLDEYYKLDYEDIIGDQPCRFKYTECVPNDFGLTVEEIMMASNKELNQWASLKKTMQNRPMNVEMNDVEKYNRKRNNVDLKKKIFLSVYGPQADDEDQSDGEQNVVEKALETMKKPKVTQVKVKVETVVKEEEPVKELTKAQRKKLKKQNKKKNYVMAPEVVEVKEEPKKEVKPQKSPKKVVVKEEVEVVEIPVKKVKKVKVLKVQEDTVTSEETVKEAEPVEVKEKRANKRKREEVTPQVSTNNSNKKAKTNNGNSKNVKKDFKKKPAQDISDERLKAFGINPKKYFNKLKFGGQNKSEGGGAKQNGGGVAKHNNAGAAKPNNGVAKQNGHNKKDNQNNKTKSPNKKTFKAK
ncbi:unnamed protein product [Diamesa hyperborea]